MDVNIKKKIDPMKITDKHNKFKVYLGCTKGFFTINSVGIRKLLIYANEQNFDLTFMTGKNLYIQLI